ncbi:MAG: lipid II flippase MurJ, partial [Ilumatobacteraceae bacterium]
FTFAFAFFVLPHALIAVPVATAVAPRVADAWQRGLRAETGDLIERSARVVVPLLLLAGAGLVALAWPVTRVVASFGQAASQGLAPIAHAMAAFGFGLVGYGMAFMMTRVLFSLEEVKRAAVLLSGAALAGVVVMGVAASVLSDANRAAALALGYGATQTMSAAVLTLRVRQVTGSPSWASLGRLSIGSAVAAVASGAVMAVVQHQFATDRASSAAAIVVAGTCGVAVFLLVAPPLTGVRVSALLRRSAARV